MAGKRKTNGSNGKRVTRYTYDDVKEPRSPETGHTALLPTDELTVTLPMDNGWGKKLQVGRLPEDGRPIVVDMDPDQDPVLFWSGKRNRREIPVLPLQRNEIVTESRIAQIIERAKKAAAERTGATRQAHLFADLERTLRESEKAQRVEFYTHDEGWKNKMICGDSLQVTESLVRYEGLAGKVQMIYMDPPYGIKYDSNFQQRVDSTKNDEGDQADDILTIKAFRDTWALGIHSYLSYLQERLYLCRQLLADSGSIFVQISDTNIHLVRALMDECFGAANCCGLVAFRKTGGQSASLLAGVADYLLWYSKERSQVKYRPLFKGKADSADRPSIYSWLESPDGRVRRRMTTEEQEADAAIPNGWRIFAPDNLTSSGVSPNTTVTFEFEGRSFHPGTTNHWKTTVEGLRRLVERRRLIAVSTTLYYVRYLDDFPFIPLDTVWTDTSAGGYTDKKVYTVQTNRKILLRCIAMTTDPGDLVFDPTCGSGTTALCSESLGRRWVTCDTSRVAINVARQRLLSATYNHYKTRNGKVSGNFLYKTVDRVTLKSLAYGLEPEKVELVDQPELDREAIRVTGPFEVMSIGRYSIEDWKGYVAEAGRLTNYIEVICRLYRKDAAVQGSGGLIHAVSESETEGIGISVGPLSGRVTGKQINDAVQDALAAGILEVHILGWAFEANVGEIKSQLESRGRVKVELVMIRPDTLAEGLKVTKPEMLFSPLALPDLKVEVRRIGKNAPEAEVYLKGVAVFDRKTRATDYKAADSGYVAAWYLDEDYDGDCFVDCQMFFDFKKAPNLKAALRVDVDPEEFELQTSSQPFPIRDYKRIAVKVVDVFGNESTVVKELV